MATIDAMRQECWDRALEAYGTAHIFERRSQNLRRRLQILTFLGFLPTVVAGAYVLSFGVSGKPVGVVLAAAASVAILQLVASLWALVAQWVDGHGYSVEAASINHRLSQRFESLAKNPPGDEDQMARALESINADDQARRDLDYRRNIRENEKRRGMRAALRQFRRPCAECGLVPASMMPTDCGVCGNYR